MKAPGYRLQPTTKDFLLLFMRGPRTTGLLDMTVLARPLYNENENLFRL